MARKRISRPRVKSWHETEKMEILAALKATNYNPTVAAWLLGIGKTTIYRKLRSYGITRQVHYGSR